MGIRVEGHPDFRRVNARSGVIDNINTAASKSSAGARNYAVNQANKIDHLTKMVEMLLAERDAKGDEHVGQ